ncbi:ketopantoate reductase [Mesorhizobium albiziae]|uniref:2-dehydropantoate 2-reductase n=1 Tax=Neomesorhizobium albiziae TaxID=335020 RepID=A0A1I4E0F2_9HYPH|nr:2-dehydropantoate 2-reductase [Mesorhizobium albiziae]GLS31241.1 2-dehydropantoate 2-reductase [Mesorhizobium albiziae]SFK99324.1 ketopantoate reductase [Mesorhizobium albiziae]
MSASQPKISVFGAGSIGCYVGGRLAAAGADVSFVGRERLATEIAKHGLLLTDYRGADLRISSGDVDYRTDPAGTADAGLILVTVKSGATAEAGKTLAGLARPDAVIVSFQNGVGNAEILREAVPGRNVLAGMVPFNVIRRGPGHFHQGTEGALDVQKDEALAPFLQAFGQAGLPLHQHADLAPVQWAKLLLNLNNAVNALSGQPLKAELSQRDYRRCLALAQQEALDVLGDAVIRPAKLTPLPPSWLPFVLRLPDALFRIIAGRMLAMDPLARSSMLDDLDAGRATEVDWLNGEIVRLAGSGSPAARVNARLVELVHAAEQGGRRNWPGDALLERLQSPR